jgi:hypothetical protein
MAAFVAWLDYSERERRQALDVIDLFREQDTRDELGIGTIRDALAERLFPGINTIQTRARYFLFIPWTCLELERRQVSSADAALRARKEEVALIEALLHAGETAGVIGVEARAALKRLPSNIYWLGLGTWGIRLFAGGQDQYFSSLDGRRRTASHRATDDPEGGEVGRVPPSWHPAIPARPADFPTGASLSSPRCASCGAATWAARSSCSPTSVASSITPGDERWISTGSRGSSRSSRRSFAA